MRALLIALAACSSSAPPPQATPPIVATVPVDAAPPAPTRYTIAAGTYHACARTHDGHVACWGELGYSASVTRGSVFFPDENPTKPVIVPGLDHVVGLTAGGDERCAWTERGEVWCWGKVDTQDADVRAPAKIAGITDAIQVSGGQLGRMFCALRRDHHVACWGSPTWQRDNYHDRGVGLLEPKEVRQVPEIHDAVEIAVAFEHACARLAIGTVVCWDGPTPVLVTPLGEAAGAISLDGAMSGAGAAFAALLPNGKAAMWTLPDHEAIAVPDFPKDAQTIALGNEVCARGADVTCWHRGDPANHRIAIDHPVDLSGGDGVTCARTADGAAHCWGVSGTRGDGSTTQALDAVDVPGLANVTSLDISQHTTCAVANGGHVSCWGARLAYTRKNDLDYPEDESPIEVAGIANATQVLVYDTTACAHLATNRTVCWGDDRRDTKTARTWMKPTDVPELAGTGTLDGALCMGKRCLVRGIGGPEPHHAKLLALPGVTRSFGGGFARESWTCVATAKDVQCLYTHYGRGETDYYPETGFEIHANAREAINVPPGAGMCLRMADGTVECNDFGTNPTPIAGITDAIALAHGPNYGVCAVENSGIVACWPEELRSAQRGPGPKPVVGATDAVSIASGPDHACIVRRGGTVACWGQWSLVGRGATASDAPTTVANLAM